MKRILAVLSLVSTLAARVAAGGAGADPFAFLSLDANARPVGLGGAYTALAADANALLYNPAGLARVERNEATFMHNEYFEGIGQEYAAYASPRRWGASLNFTDFGDAPRTTYSDPAGASGETAGLYSLALSGGKGFVVSDGLAAGVAGKLIRESVAGFVGQGIALDLGVLWSVRRAPGLDVGAAIQNIGPRVKFESQGESLPLAVRFGGAYSREVFGRKHVAALDVIKNRNRALELAVGGEASLNSMMGFRVGYDTRNDAGPGVNIGLGWSFWEMAVDYAFVPFGELGMAHRISGTWRWGKSVAPAAVGMPRLFRWWPRRWREAKPVERPAVPRRAENTEPNTTPERVIWTEPSLPED